MPDWLVIAAQAWALGGPVIGYCIGRRDKRIERQRDAKPNIRAAFSSGVSGYTVKLQIVARTSEDILVTAVEAPGPIHIGAPEPDYSALNGEVVGHLHDFRPSPRAVDWRVPGNESLSCQVTVDGPSSPQPIVLTISSSASTLRDMRETIHPPTKP